MKAILLSLFPLSKGETKSNTTFLLKICYIHLFVISHIETITIWTISDDAREECL